MITKTGTDNRNYRAQNWLHVPNSKEPATWALRYKEHTGKGNKPTREQLNRATRELVNTFPNKEATPGLAARLVSIYKSIGLSLDEVPPTLIEMAKKSPDESIYEGLITDTFEDIQITLTENEGPEASRVTLDRENGILKNAPILGLISKNGRRYKEEAVKDAITRGVYEGLPAYKDHAEKGRPRKIDEALGTWRNTRWCESTKKARGDLQTLKAHRELVFDFADNGPTLAAPSHVVEGKVRKVRSAGRITQEVEYIGLGHSVDLVAGAATVNSLTESTESEDDSMVVDIKTCTLEEIQNLRPELFKEENSPTANTGLEEMIREQGEKIDGLVEENKTLKSDKEEAIKLAETKQFIEEALKPSFLEDDAKDLVRSDSEGLQLTKEQAEALVKQYEGFAKVVNPDAGKAKGDLENDDGKEGKKDASKVTLGEAFLIKAGLKERPKEKE